MKKMFACLCGLSILAMIHHANAAVMTNYQVSIDTASIAGDQGNLDDPQQPGDAPFSFYVSLNSGGSGTVNSVTLSNFNFDGGSLSDPPNIQIMNNASGSLASTISLNDSVSGGFNSFQEDFVAGNTLSFDLDTTSFGIDPSSQTPDNLSIQIIDGGGYAVGTLAPDTSDSLIEINYDTPLEIDTYASDPDATTSTGQTLTFNAPTITAVPEPQSLCAATLGVLILGCFNRKNKRQGNSAPLR